MDSSETKKSKVSELAGLMATVSKKHGDGSLILMGNSSGSKSVPVIPSGSISLDYALGVGGYPRGRVMEIFGPESAGKTTLTLHAIAECQKSGGTAAFIDAEHALDLKYASALGIDTDKLLFSQPDYGEQALDIIEDIVRANLVDLVVVDSVAALTPKAEIEGSMEKNHMGLQARMMSQALRKLTAIVHKTSTCLMFLNQTRCLPLDTFVFCGDSLRRISELSAGDCVRKSQCESVEVFGYRFSGRVSGKSLNTHGRGVFRVSDNHRQIVVSSGGIVEKLGADVSYGDWLIQPILDSSISNNLPYIELGEQATKSVVGLDSRCKEFDLPEVLDEDFALFLGMYYADGHMYCGPSGWRISFTEKNRERFSLVKDLCLKLFGSENTILTGNDTAIAVSGQKFVRFLQELHVGKGGQNKIVPEAVLRSRSSVVKSFIRGAFFDTHGFKDNGFIFTNENQSMLRVFSQLLYAYGIFADTRGRYLHITADDAVRFSDVIGFAEPSKSSFSSEFRCAESGRGKYDIVPWSLLDQYMTTVKGNYVGNVSELPKYNNLYVCKRNGLNAYRPTLINYLKAAGEYDLVDFLSSNRFVEILGVNNTEFDAADIEVSGGLFVADQFLTHNSKIGVVYGSNETTPGGNALKFYCSVRASIRRVSSIKNGEEIIGNVVKIKIVKNKLAPPFREAMSTILFGKGLDAVGDLLEMAVDYGLVEKAGSWFSYGGERIGQGKLNAVKYLTSDKNKHILETLETTIRTDLLGE